MPIKTHGFDNLVAPLPAGEKPWSLIVKVPAPYLSGNNQKEKHPDRDMKSMKARDHKETRTELGRTHGIPPRSYIMVDDQLGPFEGLHPDERSTAERGQ